MNRKPIRHDIDCRMRHLDCQFEGIIHTIAGLKSLYVGYDPHNDYLHTAHFELLNMLSYNEK
jgi:hypothetical protein